MITSSICANHLNGLLRHLDTQLQWFRDSVRNGDLDESRLAAGSSLVMRDLTEWPSHGWAVYYPTGGFGTQGAEFVGLVDTLVSREAVFATAQGFEAFETLVKDLLAAFLLSKPGKADRAGLRKQEGKLVKAGCSTDDIQFWRAYVRRMYRSEDDGLGEVRRVAAAFADAENHSNDGRDVSFAIRVSAKGRAQSEIIPCSWQAEPAG